MLTLTEAAERAGAARSTVWRWVKTGRLSALRGEGGQYHIDPSELTRVLDAIAAERVAAGETKRVAQQGAKQAISSPDATPDHELRLQIVRLEAETLRLRELLDAERKRSDELRRDRDDARGERDRWSEIANRLALAPPAPAVPAPPPVSTARRGWRFWAR